MATAPDASCDVFISYSHRDNVGADGKPGNGWVSQFFLALKTRIGEYLGRDASVWMDPRLHGNDEFSDELSRLLATSAVLVPIVSPGYETSQWCAREFAEFRTHAEVEQRWALSNKLAVMKVVRTPLDDDKHQAFPVDSLGYWFFELDPQTARPLRFEPDSAHYEKRLEELAQDIASFLKALETQRARPAPTRTPSREIVLACDAFGLDGADRVTLVSCVKVEGAQAISQRMTRFKGDLALDPVFAADAPMIARVQRSGLRYADDEDFLRDRIADQLAIMPWDGYVSFTTSSNSTARSASETVMQLLRGVLFDRFRALADVPVLLVLSRQLAPYWQSISDAATSYRHEIEATDGVRVVGTSAVQIEERTNAAVEIASYLGGITSARLSSGTAADLRRFGRLYPNKLRLLYDLSAGIHYSRRRPFPPDWRLT